jgi:hypothetical protein
VVGKKDQIEYSLFQNEDRDAWKQYLKKGLIKQALEFCAAKQRPYVAGIYADQLFLKKQYKDAAVYYAQSNKTFEEVTLRFIQANLYTYLIDYLIKVLEIVMQKPDQEAVKPQKLLLCTWIVELKLNEINDILGRKENEKLKPAERTALEGQYQTKQISFDSFLKQHKENVNEETIF